MPKVCPFLLIDLSPVERNHPEQYACLEDKCAWYVFTENRKGCAIAILTLTRADFALVRFLTLGEEEEQRRNNQPLKKGRKSG